MPQRCLWNIRNGDLEELYPFFGLGFKPDLAALAMALNSVTVVCLSLVLKKYIPEAKKGR